MLPTERQIGWIVVAVTAGGVLASHAADAVGGSSKALGAGGAGLGLVILMAASVWYGQRIWAAFAFVVGGFVPLKPGLVYLSFINLGFGAFLMFRVSRAQAKARAAAPRRDRRRPDGASGGEQATGSSRGSRPDDASRRPTANRRYTPPQAKNTRKGR
jgi:hypothetical protein